MKRRGQLMTGIQQMVSDKIDQSVKGLIKTGVIVRVAGRTAYVQIDGSPAIRPADLYTDAVAGDRCILTRPANQNRWLVTGRIDPTAQPPSEGQPSSGGELSPPGSFLAFTGIGGCCAWTWAAAPQKPVAYELQYNTSAAATGATTAPYSRGSHWIVTSAVDLYARIRSVGPQFQTSAWSAWVVCTPGVGGGSGATELDELADVALSGLALGDMLQYSASGWVNIPAPAGTGDMTAAVYDPDSDGKVTPEEHAASHQSGGGDPLKLDDLAAPDDNTDLNVSTSKHGLMPKLPGGTTNFYREDGTWAAPAGGGGGAGTLLARMTTPATVVSTTAETSVLTSAAVGSWTTASTDWQVGDRFHLTVAGIMHNFSGSLAGWTWRLKLGGVTFLASTVTNHASSANGDRLWYVDAYFVCHTAGVSGLLLGVADLTYKTTSVIRSFMAFDPTTLATFDLSGSVVVDLTLQTSVSHADNNSTAYFAQLERFRY